LPKRRRYWIPARIAFGSSDFVFFHWLHRRGEETGVYPLVLSRGLARVVTALYRRDVVEATLDRDVHHVQPRFASEHLERSRAQLEFLRQRRRLTAFGGLHTIHDRQHKTCERRSGVQILRLKASGAAAALLLVSVTASAAQNSFPDKPIRLVIGSAAGSGPDIISRVMGERLARTWGQRIVVDARPGVAGAISAELVSRSAPDGYTWMMLTSQLLVASSVYHDLKFNLERDFASISLIGTVAFVLVVHPTVPAKSVSELIALAKKTPLRYGSAGTGASEHLCGFMLTQMTGTGMLHVPYKGVPQALADTLAKEVHLTYAVVPAAMPMIQPGRLRAIAVTSAKRSAMLPDVPSISETVPGYDMFGWYSLVAPTGTPEPVLARIGAEVMKAAKDPEFTEQVKGLGIELVGSSRSELDAFRRDQTKRISALVKALGSELK
jgi:tripartite-type tricarboxylate transporter receptor subunit TctC